MLEILKETHKRTDEIIDGIAWTDMLPAKSLLKTPGTVAHGLTLNPLAWTLGHVAFFYGENVIPILGD